MKTVFAISFLVLFCSTIAFAQQKNPAKNYFPDVPLIDQDGKMHRFYSDLQDGKVVIISSFHSDCKTIGPPMMASLRKVQQSLAGRATEFNIISISVDPVADTPAKEKAFASMYKPGPGWYFLTGENANVDLVLRKLGMYVARVEDHTSILIVGNVKTGLWKKVNGLSKPEDIKAAVESVLDDRGQ